MGNFNIQTGIQIDSTTPTTGEFFSQVVATTSNFLPDNTSVNRQIMQGMRRIEVGGLVFTQGIDLQAINIDATQGSNVAALCQQLWTINDIDEDAFAVGVEYPWGNNSAPIANTALATQENWDEPIRILDRCAHAMGSFDAQTTDSPVQTYSFRRSRSLRLKVPLSDGKILLWTTHLFPQGVFPLGTDLVGVSSWIVGTIYFKYLW